jgi:acyl carrier protein
MAFERGQLLQEVTLVLKGPCGVLFEVAESSRLAEDLQLDSVGLLALALNLEKRFQVRLPEDPSAPPETVSDIVDLLERTLGGASA